jgi:nucleotide-binding universal stress UspA family protein
MAAPVVVGVDGSEGSREALRQALIEARLRGTRVRAVAAWRLPWTVYSAAVPGVDLDEVIEDVRASAAARLDEALAGCAAEADGIEVIKAVCEGQPAEVLVEQSQGAAILVVGSRGLGGFQGLLLGSVSQQCAHHAACPVVIVRSKPDGD